MTGRAEFDWDQIDCPEVIVTAAEYSAYQTDTHTVKFAPGDMTLYTITLIRSYGPVTMFERDSMKPLRTQPPVWLAALNGRYIELPNDHYPHDPETLEKDFGVSYWSSHILDRFFRLRQKNLAGY